ncbi:hypothetical protein DFP72DRAFT_916357, partial [Ephemerocybe angulata]
MAEVAQHLFIIPSIPTYNISLNLTSILSFLPSKHFLTRSKLFKSIRTKWWEDVKDMGGAVPATGGGLLVDVAAWPTESMLEAVVNEVSPDATTLRATASPSGLAAPPPPPLGYPGPWGFFTSGYMLGLLLVANIIVPSRVPASERRRRYIRRMQRLPGLGALWDAVFPLDLSRTTTRLALHLPSLYSLGKVLLIWGVLVLQTSDMYPKEAWAQRLGAWVEAKEMKDVCWKTFVAVCSGFAVEGFVKALDGVEAGFPIGSNMNPNTSPFNIVGYAFLLHLYASPFAHSISAYTRGETRHAVITLTMFHALSISKRLSTHRLLPTTLSSVLSLMHFHGALFSYFSGAKSATSTSATRSQLLTTYPILNYIPNIFETMLILTIVLTIVLNILVQIVVRGRVDRVFSGLGIRGASWSSHPVWDQQQDEDAETVLDDQGGVWEFLSTLPFDEDFGVLLLRIGTASLEATGLRGWSNEVAPIAAAIPPGRRRRIMAREAAATQGLADARPSEYGRVRMGRAGAGGVQVGGRAIAGPSRQASVVGGGLRRRRQGAPGLHNEVRTVDLGVSSLEGDGERVNATMRSRLFRYLEESARYLGSLWAAFKGLLRVARAGLAWAIMERSSKMHAVRRRVHRQRQAEEEKWLERERWAEEERERERERESEERERDLYEQFLRGDEITDDEQEYQDEEVEEVELDDENGREEGEEQDDGSEDEREAFGLFSDLLRNEGDTSGGGNGAVVLAHLLDKSPMTPARSVCVICTSEARDVICWPCRCLAMCDGCREALAARSAPTKHR